MLNKEFLRRISDIDMAIKNFREGLYSDEEFEAVIQNLCRKIINIKSEAIQTTIQSIQTEQRNLVDLEAEQLKPPFNFLINGWREMLGNRHKANPNPTDFNN